MWGKVGNAFLLFISYKFSKWRGKPWHKGLPLSISVEPTTACNLRCPHCPSGLRDFTRPTGFMDYALFTKTMDEISRKALFLTLYFQGEPYLHKDFFAMVRYATDKGLWVSTSTNAHYLNVHNAEQTVLSGLKKIVLSLDGIQQDTYEIYRVGGQIQKVWEGLENLQEAKKKYKSVFPKIYLQFIVFKHNEHEIPQVRTLAKKLGLTLQLKTAQLYGAETYSEWLPKNPIFARYAASINGAWRVKNKLLNECWRMWHSAVVTWDGQVVPCCFDKDATHSMGTLKTHTFAQIWSSDTYHTFRSKLFESRKNIEICKNCTEGSPVFV